MKTNLLPKFTNGWIYYLHHRASSVFYFIFFVVTIFLELRCVDDKVWSVMVKEEMNGEENDQNVWPASMKV